MEVVGNDGVKELLITGDAVFELVYTSGGVVLEEQDFFLIKRVEVPLDARDLLHGVDLLMGSYCVVEEAADNGLEVSELLRVGEWGYGGCWRLHLDLLLRHY